MKKIHISLLEALKNESESSMENLFQTKSDDELLRLIFSNYRTDLGIRLTNQGLAIMSEFYNSYEINFEKEHKILASEILFLEKNASLPYYFTNKNIVLFEEMLAVRIKLAGSVAVLADAEK